MRTDVINRILTIFIISLSFFSLSQTDTSYVEEEDTIYYEEQNPGEYFRVHKGNSYTYLKNGGDYDTIMETIAEDIRNGGLFTTNRDVNVNINSFALDRRNDSLYGTKYYDSIEPVISDYIGNSRAEESISLFCYYMADSLKNDFVLRIFDEVESCTCSKSAFDEIVDSKKIAEAIVNPNLKWMTFSYFQHYNKDGFLDEYIFVEYKMRWSLIRRTYMLILEGNE
jgi:hypothetical protein